MYLLDANVLITAKNSYYGFDICPGFWEWLVKAFSEHKAASISAVYAEILKGDDDLTNWVKSNKTHFLPLTPESTQRMGELMKWASEKDFTQRALDEFAQSADLQLVAFATAHGHRIVTHETYDANTKRRIKIPNACRHLAVSFTDPFTMMRAENVTFTLTPHPNPL